jgi:hypothetical protein
LLAVQVTLPVERRSFLAGLPPLGEVLLVMYPSSLISPQAVAGQALLERQALRDVVAMARLVQAVAAVAAV